MHILMVSHGYPPTISGVTLVVQKLSRAMVRSGHDVTVVTASHRHIPHRTEDQGVRLIRIRGLPNPFWREGPIPAAHLGALEEIADEVRPDLVHVHEAAVLGQQALRLKRLLAIPAVATCYFVPRFVGRYLSATDRPSRMVERVTWRYSIRFFNRFDRVVFGTAAHRRFYLDHGLEAPTAIITNGVDVGRYRPPDGRVEDVALRYRLPPRPRILFVSRLMRDKEIDVLIRAMPAITARQPAHLLIVGRGPDRPRLERITAELDMQDHVHFMGFVPEADVPALYRVSDLFAITSTTEVQSIPTLQAAATALPIVAVDAVALPEVVKNEQNGLLVPPDDPESTARAILRILHDRELAGQMGQASLAISRPHAEARMFQLYEQLYHELNGSPPLVTTLRPAHEALDGQKM